MNLKNYIIYNARAFFIGKFLKIKSKPYLTKYVHFESSFLEGIEIMKLALIIADTTKDKIEALEYLINCIKIDIQSDLLSNIIYRKEALIVPLNLFPRIYFDKTGNKHQIKSEPDVIKEINLETDYVMPNPWKKTSFINAIKKINDNGFKYKHGNHMAIYYTEVDICEVENGHHTITAAIYKKTGKIKAQVIDISPLLENVYSNDGLHWYDVHSKNKIREVKDFRIALIFEITKEKLKLEKEQEK